MAEVARDAGGTLLIAVGTFGFAIGCGISVTGIGALCGIPLALVSLIPFAWGMLMRQKANRLRQEAYMQKSVREVSMIHAASQGVAICGICGAPNPVGSRDCSMCKTPIGISG